MFSYCDDVNFEGSVSELVSESVSEGKGEMDLCCLSVQQNKGFIARLQNRAK